MSDDSGGASRPEPEQPDWRTLHLWQIQPVRDVLLVLAVVGLLYFGYLISVVTVPLLLALLLAYLFEPLVARLTHRKWMSRQGAAAGIIAGAVVIVIVPMTLALSFALIQGVSYAQRLGENTRELVASVETPDDPALREALPNDAWRAIRDYMVEVRVDEDRVQEAGEAGEPDADPDAPEPDDELGPLDELGGEIRSDLYNVFRFVATWIETNREALGRRAIETGQGALAAALNGVMSLGLFAFTAFLTAFFFFFISSSFGHVLAFFRELLPEDEEDQIVDLATKMDRVIAGFVRGRMLIAAIQSVVFAIAYWLIGVPAPLILGPVVGILSIVPYVALVGVPVSIVLLWLEPSGVAWQNAWWWVLGAPVAVYFAVQALDDYVLTPLIQGKSTNMETPFILFASIAGGAVAGVYGLLLGIPVAACAKILITEVVWPRFEAWKEGRAKDPLPFGTKN